MFIFSVFDVHLFIRWSDTDLKELVGNLLQVQLFVAAEYLPESGQTGTEFLRGNHGIAMALEFP
jgi:hypothetical protein